MRGTKGLNEVVDRVAARAKVSAWSRSAADSSPGGVHPPTGPSVAVTSTCGITPTVSMGAPLGPATEKFFGSYDP